MHKHESVQCQVEHQMHFNLQPTWFIKELLHLKTVDLCLNFQFFINESYTLIHRRLFRIWNINDHPGICFLHLFIRPSILEKVLYHFPIPVDVLSDSCHPQFAECNRSGMA